MAIDSFSKALPAPDFWVSGFTYSLCNFSGLYNVFHPPSVWMFMSSVFSHILVNQQDFSNDWKGFTGALNNQQYVSAGIYFGKVFTDITSYSL